MKNKTKKRSFLIGMLIYAVVYLVLLAIGLNYFWKYMAAYEASRPQNTIEAYVSQLTGEHICDLSGELLDSLDANLQSREQARAVICEEVSGGITYAKKTSACTDTQIVYVLRCGSQVIGSVTMTPAEEGGYGFMNWKVTQESFDFSYLMGEGMEVTVPSEYTVCVNGFALDESYITVDDIHYSALEEFYDDYDLPVMVTYQTSGVLGASEMEVTDVKGNVVDLSAYADPNLYLYNCTEEENAELESFCGEFLEKYIAYTGCAEGTAQGNFERLKKYLVSGSELEDRLFQAMAGLKYAKSKGDEIVSITINYTVNLGDGRYLCDVTYLVDTTGNAGVVRTTNNMQIIILRSGDSLLAEALTIY